MENDGLILSIDYSMRHGVGVLWDVLYPAKVVVLDDNKDNICDGISDFVKNVECEVEKLVWRTQKSGRDACLSHIFIEEPLRMGPNQGTIVDLFFVLGNLFYALWNCFSIEPIFLHQSKIKTFITGHQKKGVDKKKLVEEKMLLKYPEIFEKLPDRKRMGKGDSIYDRKYKINISDCADALAVGEYGISEIKKELSKLNFTP